EDACPAQNDVCRDGFNFEPTRWSDIRLIHGTSLDWFTRHAEHPPAWSCAGNIDSVQARLFSPASGPHRALEVRTLHRTPLAKEQHVSLQRCRSVGVLVHATSSKLAGSPDVPRRNFHLNLRTHAGRSRHPSAVNARRVA